MSYRYNIHGITWFTICVLCIEPCGYTVGVARFSSTYGVGSSILHLCRILNATLYAYSELLLSLTQSSLTEPLSIRRYSQIAGALEWFSPIGMERQEFQLDRGC